MKKITLCLIMITSIVCVKSQNYQLSFSGNGSSNTVDSILVHNLTQGLSEFLYGSDTLLLVVSTGTSSHNLYNYKPQIFPNPSFDNVSVQFEMHSESDAHLQVFNSDGRCVIEKSFRLFEGLNSFQISGLSSGIYYVRCATSKNEFSEKFVVLGNSSALPEICFKSYEAPKTLSHLNKSCKNIVQMPYNQGDVILMEGYSGIYSSILTLSPTASVVVDFDFIPCTDGDGNHYPVVKIGTQIWMAANLRTTNYNNGNDITTETDDLTWGNLTGAAYCWHSNDSLVNGKTYGALYNFEAVNTGLLCPIGWHVPTQAEWDVLFNFLGGISIAGGKIRETGTQHWTAPNAGATNVSGFTALPSGSRYGSYNNGTFAANVGLQALWWTATEVTTTTAWYNDTHNMHGGASGGPISKEYGMSVRCIKN